MRFRFASQSLFNVLDFTRIRELHRSWDELLTRRKLGCWLVISCGGKLRRKEHDMF